MKISEVAHSLFEEFQYIMEGEGATIVKSGAFNKAFKKLSRDAQIKKAYFNFEEDKRTNPTGRYGNSDYPFSKNNILGGVMHCHLTRDVTVIYIVDSNTVHMIEIGTHRDFGTGTPGNINKFKSLAKRVNNYRQSAGIL